MSCQRSRVLALVLQNTVGFCSQMGLWGWDRGSRLTQVLGCDEESSGKSGFGPSPFPTDFATRLV